MTLLPWGGPAGSTGGTSFPAPPPPPHPPTTEAGAAGFALLEVLVALVVFSVGILGMVGMQALALQSNREARLQAQATALGRELAEMMRGNPRVALGTTSANPYLGAFSVGGLIPSAPHYCLSVTNAATGCTSPTHIAAAQMTDWLARVDQVLPSARVTVCWDDAPYDADGLPQWPCTAPSQPSLLFIKIGWRQRSTDHSRTGSNAWTEASAAHSHPGLVLPVTPGSPL